MLKYFVSLFYKKILLRSSHQTKKHNMNSSEYSIRIKTFLINDKVKNRAFFPYKQKELDYLLENPEELNDIISKIYSNYRKYSQNGLPFTDIKWYVENVLDKKVFWSSYYIKELYFNRERIN